ncbi:MAG: MgtC/SapB family protein [Candidatus Omnitrophota bacterium]|nr:MAG: MgtC/SapB family protein [Candidatus Omnitrophota bacterium]
MIGAIQVLFRLILATILGGIVGFERERHEKAAGFRTHILVCIGSCLIMLTSMHMFDVYKGTAALDPARIAAGVVTGIGFLGAGTIIRFGATVRGLTTAASLWAIAGVGLAVGSGFYWAAVITSAIILICLYLLTKVEAKISRKSAYDTLMVESKPDIMNLQNVKNLLSNYNTQMHDFQISKLDNQNVVYSFDLKLLTPGQYDIIIEDVMKLEGIKSARWERHR